MGPEAYTFFGWEGGSKRSVRMARHDGAWREAAGRTTPPVPDKLRFRIGEVARICDVPSYVLRFWEREFPQLRPAKGETGQRLYRRRDVAMALRIRRLLYAEGYTIPGARQILRGNGSEAGRAGDPEAELPDGQIEQAPMLPGITTAEPQSPAGAAERLRWVEAELRGLLEMLGGERRPAAGRRTRPAERTGVDTQSQGLFDGLDVWPTEESGDE